MSKRRSKRRAALTLIDVSITLLIIGLLAAVAAPRYAGSQRRFQVRCAARRVAADLQFARRRARSSSTTQSVVFTPASNRYELPGLADLDHPGRPFRVDLRETAYPASIASATFGDNSTVVFDIYGIPANEGEVIVAINQERRTVQIDALGEVTILP